MCSSKYPLAVLLAAFLLAGEAAASCTGDCNLNHQVTVDELVRGVRNLLAPSLPPACAAIDADGSGAVDRDELLAAVAGALGACPEAIGGCNGDTAMCQRRFDEVAYATTHNAMSAFDEGWRAPNQYRGIPGQLADGVRGLMLDVHYLQGETYLCHALCGMGKKPLAGGLAEIAAFLHRHPREVMTIIFESYVAAADIAAAFESSGLLQYVHTQAPDDPWPTLREMIDGGRRLVVFTDRESGVPPWYHDVWAYAWETHYHFEHPEDLSCAINRGDMANSLFILNHFLTNPVASPQFAELVNFNPLFIDRAQQCVAESGRLPNFVTVDFHDIGDVFAVVAALNERP